LHHDKKNQLLQLTWFCWWKPSWDVPAKMIREYLGAKIALYFLFLSHYCTWLLPLALLGGFVQMGIYSQINIFGSFSIAMEKSYYIVFYSFFISQWTEWMLAYWKSEERHLAMEIGLCEFEEEEQVRRKFIGETKPSHINGKPIKIYPVPMKIAKQRLSLFVIFILTIVVVLIVSSIFYLKYNIRYVYDLTEVQKSEAFIGSDLINAVAIAVMKALFDVIAVILTDNENCRTDTEHEDSIIGKLFVFNFINSFASLFYIAFIKGLINDDCVNDSCMEELGNTLITLLLANLLGRNVMSVILPKILNYYSTKRELGNGAEELIKVEKEFIRPEFAGTLIEYNEISIQYGFTTLFVSAIPLAPIIALFFNMWKIRIDGTKLLNNTRRPLPLAAEDIGTWYYIFSIISKLSVFSNAAIIFYIMRIFEDFSVSLRFVFGILFVIISFLGHAFIHYIISTTKLSEVDIQLQRSKFINKKLIDLTFDESEEEIPQNDSDEVLNNIKIHTMVYDSINKCFIQSSDQKES
jgi:anoctamin-10/anoctamin-7